LFEAISQHHTLSVMPTFGCTAACKHCGTFSSPRNHASLGLQEILSAIDQAVENHYKVVVFTGGEPTLAGDHLLRGIERASLAGLVTRIVTNGWWATDESSANRFATSLVKAGLTEINFSTGDQHSKFVPVENIFRACVAMCEAGLRSICIMVETVLDRVITETTITQHPAFMDMTKTFPQVRIQIFESPWMPMSPSAQASYPRGMAVHRGNIAERGGCNSCLSTTTIQADGRIAACCGLGVRSVPELQIGHITTTSLREADEVAANDFLKRWIRVEGPERILAWAAAHDEQVQWENMYAHKCQACLRLYKDQRVRDVIKQHHQEKMADVLFAEWLLFHFNPSTATTASSEQTGEGAGVAEVLV
jgi:organic radical activating enzyme